MARMFNLKRLSRKSAVIAGLVLIVVVVAAIALLNRPEKIATIPSTSPSKTTADVNSDKQLAPSSVPSSGNASTASSDSAKSSSSQTSSQPTGTPLIVPYGNFVSSHQVSKGTVEASVCNSTPGATCYIQFTKGSLIRKLDPAIVDSNNTAYWNWTVSLDTGSWTVSAAATLNGQTKTTTDNQPLVVQ